MKSCFKCGRALPLGAFYRRPQTRDGLLGNCKDCAKAAVKAYYVATIEQRHGYERERAKRPLRRAAQMRYKSKQRRLYPERFAARNAVNYALRVGHMLKLPCSVCGNPKSEAHHADYSKPLDVQWLCLRHHRQVEGRLVA